MIPIDLSGKVALISGASQGLGAAMAETLHAAGATVAINHYPSEGDAMRAEALRARLGGATTVHAGDVSEPESISAMCGQVVAAHGGIDILINNAGITRDRTVAKMTTAEWDAVIDTNLSGVFHLTQAALPHLRSPGRIINIASVSGAVGLFGQANYAAAKAGVIGFTKTLSRELARKRVTVNAIAPGLALTEMGATVPEAIREQWVAAIPLGRFAEPGEIAGVALFLASDLSSYLTGQTLHVNGGWYV